MKQILLSLAILLALVLPAHADCTVEYKAKRDNPLELFFETAQISGTCTKENAAAELKEQLAEQGLILLKIVSVSEQ
ncbi:hypothetical protein [Roseovarius sp. EL26]|uniref:hypothetical protein n=1 Tax=Roseovarius sp. EL26 TaxID=2126672 RepID=UPI000EA2D672|nr:hypothetical protein [Roseovarius sp. EL26]